jgi:ubiquinone/menaquinone biosynthesis C-methylase UbiE
MSRIDADAFNAFERAGWADASGAAYDSLFGPITRRVASALLDAAGVKKDTRVLDVATGPGYVAGRAAARGAVTLGVDFSPRMLRRASKGHPDVQFREADAETLSGFADASFDAVVSNFCILHLGRPEAAAKTFARVLVPGGRVAVTVWGKPERARHIGLVYDAIQAAGAQTPPSIPAGPDFFRFASDVEFSMLLSLAGFRGVTVQTIELKHRIHDVEELWQGIFEGTVRTRAILLGQTERMRARIRGELERLIAAHRVPDGYDLPVSIKLAAGRKP